MEMFVDVRKFFNDLARLNQTGKPEVQTFFKWFPLLFKVVRIRKRAKSLFGELCGASLYYPLSLKDLKKYGQIPLYEKSDILVLWEKLMTE